MSLVNARIHNTFYGRFLLRVLLLQPADHKNMKLFELILFKFNPSFKALNWWTWKTENLQRKQDCYEYHLSFNIKITNKYYGGDDSVSYYWFYNFPNQFKPEKMSQQNERTNLFHLNKLFMIRFYFWTEPLLCWRSCQTGTTWSRA